MKLTTTTEQRIDVQLAPEVGALLAARLNTYHDLVAQRKVLDELIDAEKDEIGATVLDTGHEKLGVGASIITFVRGVTSSLDKQKLIAGGVTMAQIEAATTTKPKKPYWKISGEGEAA